MLVERTGKIYGSKFSAAWTPERLTEWIAETIQARGWAADGVGRILTIRLHDTAGVVSGKVVQTIRIHSDGRYVHAWPVRDAEGVG